MGLFIRLAWRNLIRNRKRSAVTALGITLGIGFCITTLAIMDGLSNDLITGTTQGQVGHVQVHQKEYLAKRQVQQTIANNEDILEQLRAIGGVKGAAARLYSFGYLTRGNKSIGVSLAGIEPTEEVNVTSIAEQIIEGEFLSAPTPWPQGQALTSEQELLDKQLTDQAIADAFAELEGDMSTASVTLQEQTDQLIDILAPLPEVAPKVILGVKLAKNLQAQIGDKVVLLYETSLGAQHSLELQVAGISRQGTDLIDRTRIVFHFNDLQKLLQLPNQSHEIALSSDSLQKVDALQQQVQTVLSSHTDLTVQSWSQLRPDILALIKSNQALMGTLVFIIFLIAGVGVMNAMLVSVMERRKELSLLKALGLKGGNVVWLVTVETLLLTFVASLAGIAMGLILGSYLQQNGWDISQFGEFSLAGVGMTSALKAKLTVENVITPVVVMFIIAILAALYPAFSAARLVPAQGMRAT
ncbi:ABC transporter permease [Pseudoalteromonas tunicata]|uniref:ABC-type transport system involved in lipoprotein release permease component-like n=1 Tax=Pseudoalteromonas tunicata D2 TaxID=87626 RepID=A4C5V5_9GAMM|nr:FtsX-like permease family protein [Pseudoalteromonas tunicata]ATC95333.1 hypothetical protein PTUN_a2933 [Pseudoalteromonas tunicata]AXT30924.1 ABC transporter permease [Pseudoalteromonas tunicata]EAR29359.1 ABC-type transport system involved in lipoprotein release permease component-like [Pseudoalteromonas tunicata D2]MDP4982056.1 ABC transporter permease [Pseudoalteromonas tunicata]MDP5213089.1 ABC transporter permease [Pseudoalteromonas tunicata]